MVHTESMRNTEYCYIVSKLCTALFYVSRKIDTLPECQIILQMTFLPIFAKNLLKSTIKVTLI